MKAIVNTKLVMEDGIIWDGALTWEDGVILQVGKRSEVSIPDGAEVLDAGGKYTAPGLIDLHVHGGNGKLFAEDPAACAAYFLSCGVTSLLPTFYHNLSLDQMLEGGERIRQAAKKGAGRIMEGLYMEGPFMMLQGSCQNQLKWKDPIDEAETRRLMDGLQDLVRIWAIDPDRENVEFAMAYAKEKNPQVIFAHGHSCATAESIRRLRHYGVKVRTHMGDALTAPGRAHCTMGAGGDEFCLYDPEMYAELICDETGIHVVPDMIKMYIRTKGVERICLISDCMPGTGEYRNNPELGVWYGSDLNYDEEGKLAGSRMTLNQAVRNVMTHTGYGLCHAVRMASLNPAKLLGIDHRVGSLEKGKTANLILMDDAVNIETVILEGEIAFRDGTLCI